MGFQCIMRDVILRKKAEEELVRQRSRLEAIFRNVEDAIITVDQNLNVTEANDAASKICDLLPEQLTGGFFSIHNENCNRACRDIMKETLNGKSTIRKYLVKCGRKGSPLHKVSLWPNLCHGGAYFRCKNPAKR